MDLLTFLRTPPLPVMEAFAIAVGSTVGHLRNIAYGNRKASAALAMQIEIVTGGQVTRQSLRPDDWELIWPQGEHQVVDAAIVAHSSAAGTPTHEDLAPQADGPQAPSRRVA